MSTRSRVYDFGFQPDESPYHFALERDDTGMVTIVERFEWDRDKKKDSISERQPVLKAVLDAARWAQVASDVAEDFNKRLRTERIPTSEWKQKTTLLGPTFGKEVTLLAWAMEDMPLDQIPNILRNWKGFLPEERWWLYTTVNATSKHPQFGSDFGWRKAIRIAFSENPITDVEPLSGASSSAKATREQVRESTDAVQFQLPLE